MNTSTFRSNLRTQLLVRPNLTSLGAEVHRYPPGARATVAPTIFFNEVSVSQDGLHEAGGFDRTYTVTGEAYTRAPNDSDGSWAAAEANAITLVSEVENQLDTDPTVNGACSYAFLTNWTLAPTQDEGGSVMFMSVEFTITVRDFA